MLRHGATYAGHPTCCAAALAVLDIYERENLIPRGRELEGALAEALAPLADHPAVAEVRVGLGLLAAVAARAGRARRGPGRRREGRRGRARGRRARPAAARGARHVAAAGGRVRAPRADLRGLPRGPRPSWLSAGLAHRRVPRAALGAAVGHAGDGRGPAGPARRCSTRRPTGRRHGGRRSGSGEPVTVVGLRDLRARRDGRRRARRGGRGRRLAARVAARQSLDAAESRSAAASASASRTMAARGDDARARGRGGERRRHRADHEPARRFGVRPAEHVIVTPLHDDSWCHTVAYTSSIAIGALWVASWARGIDDEAAPLVLAVALGASAGRGRYRRRAASPPASGST